MEPGKRILYVEDEKFFADTVEHVLVAGGYSVRQAPDGEEGVRVAQEWKPDLVLLDLLLPKVDGFEVLRRLKSYSATKAIPVIILSNLSLESDVKKATKLGAQKFFVKAVTTPKDIFGVVQEAMAGA